MDTYKVLMIFHVFFTLVALLSGLISTIANPKGSDLHKKTGRFYFYSYVGVALTGFLMLFFKFKVFFLALNLFALYLILAGNYYAKKNEKIVNKNWWILSILCLTVFVYAVDVFFVIYNIEHIEYGWIIVRFTFAFVALSTLIFELTVKRNRFLLHAVMMLLSYIPLVNGVLARLSPQEYVWVFWILGYVVLIPLIVLWLKKSKKLKPLLD